MTDAIRKAIRELGDPDIARHSAGFFKAGPGQYGEGDRFIGVRVPVIRKLVRRYRTVELAALLELLRSDWHEERLFALLGLVSRFEKGGEREKAEIYEAYLAHTRFINNWDLVDGSAPTIVGGYLWERERDLLYELVDSDVLWERRISVLATTLQVKTGLEGEEHLKAVDAAVKKAF